MGFRINFNKFTTYRLPPDYNAFTFDPKEMFRVYLKISFIFDLKAHTNKNEP